METLPFLTGERPKYKAEEQVKAKDRVHAKSTPRRRQWNSFNYGEQLPEKADLQRGWESQENELLSGKRISDTHFERLKNDLAAGATADEMIRMAEDLTKDADFQCREEIKYREEQSVFWLLKAAEKNNNSEALRKLRDLNATKKNPKISTFLRMSPDQRIGFRIGKDFFSRNSERGNGFVQLEDDFRGSYRMTQKESVEAAQDHICGASELNRDAQILRICGEKGVVLSTLLIIFTMLETVKSSLVIQTSVTLLITPHYKFIIVNASVILPICIILSRLYRRKLHQEAKERVWNKIFLQYQSEEERKISQRNAYRQDELSFLSDNCLIFGLLCISDNVASWCFIAIFLMGKSWRFKVCAVVVITFNTYPKSYWINMIPEEISDLYSFQHLNFIRNVEIDEIYLQYIGYALIMMISNVNVNFVSALNVAFNVGFLSKLGWNFAIDEDVAIFHLILVTMTMIWHKKIPYTLIAIITTLAVTYNPKSTRLLEHVNFKDFRARCPMDAPIQTQLDNCTNLYLEDIIGSVEKISLMGRKCPLLSHVNVNVWDQCEIHLRTLTTGMNVFAGRLNSEKIVVNSFMDFCVQIHSGDSLQVSGRLQSNIHDVIVQGEEITFL